MRAHAYVTIMRALIVLLIAALTPAATTGAMVTFLPSSDVGTWELEKSTDHNWLSDKYTQASYDGTFSGDGIVRDSSTGIMTHYSYWGAVTESYCTTYHQRANYTNGQIVSVNGFWAAKQYNSRPDWSTSTGYKHLYCAYREYDQANGVVVSSLFGTSNEYALSHDAPACPGTLAEATVETGNRTYIGAQTWRCVSGCSPLSCQEESETADDTALFSAVVALAVACAILFSILCCVHIAHQRKNQNVLPRTVLAPK